MMGLLMYFFSLHRRMILISRGAGLIPTRMCLFCQLILLCLPCLLHLPFNTLLLQSLLSSTIVFELAYFQTVRQLFFKKHHLSFNAISINLLVLIDNLGPFHIHNLSHRHQGLTTLRTKSSVLIQNQKPCTGNYIVRLGHTTRTCPRTATAPMIRVPVSL